MWLKKENTNPTLTRQDIEAIADHDEYPPWLNVEQRPTEWADYLRHRTNAVNRLRARSLSNNPPSSAVGTWEPLP